MVINGDSNVHVDFGSGSLHYGIDAFIGVPGSGDKQLQPGLWFYCEDGRVPSP
jgi:hypothetical protein